MSARKSAVVGAVLATIASVQVNGQTAKSAGSTPAVTEAKHVFDDKLLDYRTTRFRAVRYVRVRDSFDAFCGEINITNRMGGFTGWRGFLLPLGEEGGKTLYDKPTIEGEPTSMGSFKGRYGSKPI